MNRSATFRSSKPAPGSAAMSAWLAAVTLTLAGLVSAADGQASQVADQVLPAPPDPATATAMESPAKLEDAASLSRNLWWNQSRVVELLKLSATQRSAMDRIFEEHIVARRQARQARRAGSSEPDPFRVAVEAADLHAARRAVEDRGARVAAEATADQHMVLSVLELLAAEQLGKVRTDLPKLLSHRWFMQAGGGDDDGRRRRQPDQRRPQRRGASRPPVADPAAGGEAGGGGGSGD